MASRASTIAVPVPAEDGFHHPATEDELAALVAWASNNGRSLRVRGAAHSVAHAIYNNPLDGLPNRVNWQTPSPGDNVSVMLDLYRGWRVRDRAQKLVEADAGIHLGADPSDPTGAANLETSLLYQLWDEEGWTLSNLGGITHQTVSGFTATGSSGGSVQYSVNDNLWGFRVIDAGGNVSEVTREDADLDLFHAMAPNLGLLGVVSAVIFQCVDAFNISGQEAITTVEDCAIDLFGDSPGKPLLGRFLREAEYARLVWWPQRGAERVQVWQAQRIAPQPGFRPDPYEEFSAHPGRDEILASIMLTVFGNLDDLSHARPQIEVTFDRVEELLEQRWPFDSLGGLGTALAKFLSGSAKSGIQAGLVVLKPFGGRIKREVPRLYPWMLGRFIALDRDKPGIQSGQPQSFRDYSWHGLPMDNEADDRLLPTEFTEIWLPLTRTQQVMKLLNDYFSEPDDARESYERTGLYGWELYTAKPTSFWMSASHCTGDEDDEWKEGAFRIDPYWFGANYGDPVATFYRPLWEYLRSEGIPFRLHWGKLQPASDLQTWAGFFRSHYPRWDDFLKLREQRDPKRVFVTSYWRERFDL